MEVEKEFSSEINLSELSSELSTAEFELEQNHTASNQEQMKNQVSNAAKKKSEKSIKIKHELEKFEFRRIFVLIIAGFINAIGVGLLLVPNGVIDGGFSGFSILLGKFFPIIPISVYLIVVNVPIYLFALRKMGKNVIIYSLIAIAAYSLFMYLFQHVFVFCGENLDVSPITRVILLGAVFGGLLSGVGSGLTIRCGGSLDGIEVLAVYFSKKINISVGQLVMTYNVIMYTVAGFLLGFDYPLYSIIAYAVGIKAVDGIVEGLDKAKAIMIITAKGQEVAQNISEMMGSGITMIEGHGYYSKGQKTIIYYVVNRFEIGKLKKIIAQTDSSAFISITDVSEVLGKSVKKKSFAKSKKKCSTSTKTLIRKKDNES